MRHFATEYSMHEALKVGFSIADRVDGSGVSPGLPALPPMAVKLHRIHLSF